MKTRLIVLALSFMAILCVSARAQTESPVPAMPNVAQEAPMPPPVQRFFDLLKERDPAEYARLKELRENDPDSFRAELAKRLAGLRERRGARGEPDVRDMREPGRHMGRSANRDRGPEHNPELEMAERLAKETAAAVRTATSDEEKKKLMAQLKDEVGDIFNIRETMRRERIRQMEDHVAKIKQVLDERRAQREEIIERRVNQLLQPESADSWREQRPPPAPQ